MKLVHGERRHQAELIARQGEGARYDAENAPHGDLLLARRGTAHFARVLNSLNDDVLREPSSRPEQSCARVVFRISHQARAMAHLLAAARANACPVEEPPGMPRDADFDLGASLPARALRHLFHHSAVHLDVEWRDFPGDRWDAPLTLPDGKTIPARDLPRLRAVEIWNAAADLEQGNQVGNHISREGSADERCLTR